MYKRRGGCIIAVINDKKKKSQQEFTKLTAVKLIFKDNMVSISGNVLRYDMVHIADKILLSNIPVVSNLS